MDTWIFTKNRYIIPCSRTILNRWLCCVEFDKNRQNMPRNLVEDERSRILVLHRKGRNISQISQELNVARATVRRWIHRDSTKGSIADRPRTHPLRILTKADIAEIVQVYREQPFTDTSTFAQRYDCSAQTIRTALRHAGLHYKKPAKKVIPEMKSLTKRDYRAILFYNFKRGLNKEECLNEMLSVFGSKVLSLRDVERSYLRFENGEFGLDNDRQTATDNH